MKTISLRNLRCFGTALVSFAAFAATAADNSPAVTALEKFEVVGSRIPRVDIEPGTALTVVDRVQIDRIGATRLAEVLLQLPYFSLGSFDKRFGAPENLQGAAAVSLRGLGPGATLVLLNGRRIVPYGIALEDGSAFGDLNSLPLAAVERIEILRDGASAIYGSDALAGVINVVLRRDFRGVEATVAGGASSRGDAGRSHASLAAGTGSLERERYNVFAVLEVLKETRLLNSDRALSRSADQRANGGSDNRSPESFPPTIRFPSGTFAPAPGCPPDRVRPVPDELGAECVFDVAPYAYLLPDVARADLLVVANYLWSPQTRLFAEVSAGHARTARRFSPSPSFVELPAGSAANPYGVPVGVFFRLLDAGARRLEATVDSARLVAGAGGSWREWAWEVSGGINRIETDFRVTSSLRRSRLNAAVGAGRFSPFTTVQDPGLIAQLSADTRDRFDSQLGFLNVKGSADAARLPLGPLVIALGGETRFERFSTRLDPLILAGDLAGDSTLATEDGSGRRRVDAAFAEASAPVFPDVELQLAGRFDHYPGFGGALSPRSTLRWQPSKGLLLRLSAGRGFLPPALFQIHQPPYAQEEQIRDPIRCPVTRLPSDCIRSVPYALGGNPALRPERSRQLNVGIAWEPSPAWSAAMDFWSIDHRGKITLAEDHLLDNEAAFPGRVVRGSVEPRDAQLGIPGLIVEIRDAFINLARQKTRGIDLEAQARVPLRSLGQIALGGLASYQQSFQSQLSSDSPVRELAGGDGRPRLRAQMTASWKQGAWDAGFALRYIGTYRFEDGVAGAGRSAPSWTTLDAHATWSVLKSARLAVVVRNLLDRGPPFRPDRISGYDSRVHDPVGRYFLATLRWTF